MASRSFVKYRVTKKKLVIEISVQDILARVDWMNRGLRRDSTKKDFPPEEAFSQFKVRNGPALLKFYLREMRAGRGGSGEALDYVFDHALFDALASPTAQRRGWVIETECVLEPESYRRIHGLDPINPGRPRRKRKADR